MPASKGLYGAIAEMTDADLHGFDLQKLTCRSCSGYGNCGYKSYRLYQGNVVSICMQRMDKLEAARAAEAAE